MGLTIRTKPVAPVIAATNPTVEPKKYTILDALAELGERKGTLMLIHDASGVGYQVVAWDAAEKKARLKNPDGALLNPRITEREAVLYSPLWR